jgi:hypothetical protein
MRGSPPEAWNLLGLIEFTRSCICGTTFALFKLRKIPKLPFDLRTIQTVSETVSQLIIDSLDFKHSKTLRYAYNTHIHSQVVSPYRVNGQPGFKSEGSSWAD